jgi:signal transduction histidine kinase
MRQVILNLLINAKHAMPNGGTITISCNNIKISGKSYHQFKLSDTGMGMSEEVLSKIFTPFFTTKPEGKGTGLGLSVVYGIIQEHGGTISAQSAEGKGTTFIITLPVLNLKS